MPTENGRKKSIVPFCFFVLSGFILVAAFWVLFRGEQSLPTPKPLLTFTPATVQFGSVSQGIEDGKVVITNTSDKTINIKSITKGCDCTEVLVEQGPFSPGKKRDMSFQWDTRGRRGDNGIVIAVSYLVEGETKERVAPLTLEAVVIPDFEVLLGKLTFFANHPETRQITLQPSKTVEIKIQDMIINHPAFTATVSPDALSITVQFDPESWTDGLRVLNAQVATTSDNEPVFSLPISIRADNSVPARD